jgi:hypothetical protein
MFLTFVNLLVNKQVINLYVCKTTKALSYLKLGNYKEEYGNNK